MGDFITSNTAFSGCDIVASIDILDANNNRKSYVLGSLLTLTYSTFQDKKPVRALGNINAIDYVYGPRTIAGSMIFAVFNKHIIYEIASTYNKCLMDELPPFDISISFANEYGIQSRMAIYGVRIISEGQTISVNDIYTENTYQYVAQDVEYIKDITTNSMQSANKNSKLISSNSSTTPVSTTSSKDLVSAINKNNTINSNKVVSSTVNLACKTIDALSYQKLGVAKLTLSPSQKEGTTTIIDSNNNSINIDNSEYPYSSLYVPLQCGDYTASYQDKNTGLNSNTVNFTITYSTAVSTTAAPLIVQRTNSSFKVMINNLKHDTLKYGIVISGATTIYNSIPITSTTLIINNLIADTTYSIYSCNKDTASDKVTVSTLKDNTSLFDLITSVVESNTKQLKYTTDDYISVINYAKEIYLANNSSTNAFSISNSFMAIRQKAVADYNSTSDSNSKSNYLKIQNICSELVDIALTISNNESYYLNKYSETTMPSQVQQTDVLNNIFAINQNTSKINIYDPLSNMALVQSVNPQSDQTSITISNLKNGQYNTIAVNTNGVYSPISDFYVLSDSEKTDYYNNTVATVLNYNTETEYYRQKLEGTTEFDSLSSETQNRILFELVKTPILNLMNPPTIIECTDKGIVVGIDTSSTLFGDVKYYVVLCDINKVITNNINFKQEIAQNTTEVTFSDEQYGIKSDTSYCIWIENGDGQQVSNAVTTKINDTDSSVINSIGVSDYISNISSSLKAVFNYDSKIDEIITSVSADESVSKDNVYDKVIEKILACGNTLINRDSYIISVLQLKYNLVNNQFFLLPVYYHKGQSVVFPSKSESYIANVTTLSYYDDQMYSTPSSIICNGETNINLYSYSGDYVYIVCREQSDFTYSGVILINMQNSNMTYFGMSVQEV